MRFRDRTEGGRRLAAELQDLDLVEPVVLALPRGGVPVEYARTYVRGDRMRYQVDREIARSSQLAEVER